MRLFYGCYMSTYINIFDIFFNMKYYWNITEIFINIIFILMQFEFNNSVTKMSYQNVYTACLNNISVWFYVHIQSYSYTPKLF